MDDETERECTHAFRPFCGRCLDATVMSKSACCCVALVWAMAWGVSQSSLAAKQGKTSVTAVFVDLKSAIFSITRQLILKTVRTDGNIAKNVSVCRFTYTYTDTDTDTYGSRKEMVRDKS